MGRGPDAGDQRSVPIKGNSNMHEDVEETPARPHPIKAYQNLEFLNSADARTIRILCEFIEPGNRLRRKRVKDTIVFFGSARIKPIEESERALRKLRAGLDGFDRLSKDDEAKLRRAEWDVKASRFYSDARELARRMTEWSMGLGDRKRRFIVCSGGGPGIMEAANRGATDAGGLSVGLNISLLHEQEPNPYQTPDLAFEFHYFFMRKFWFFYLAKALIVFPGGYGTMDELFELLTIVQTQKTSKYMPIVLYGTSYWNEILNFDNMFKWGVVDEEDLSMYHKVDSVDEAFDYLTHELTIKYL